MKNDWKVVGDEIHVELVHRKGNKIARFDRSDLPFLLALDCALCAQPRKRTTYVLVWSKFFGSRAVHTELLNPPVEYEIDHVNGDGLDNRRSNLQIVSHLRNTQNRSLISYVSKSGFRGLYFQSGKWQARIQVKGKSHYLGRFSDLDSARFAVRDFLLGKQLPFRDSPEKRAA